MSQVYSPAAALGAEEKTRRRDWWVDPLIVAGLIALLYGLVEAASHWTAPLSSASHIDVSPRSLPLYAALSTLRMALAYLLSLGFSLAYARLAATNRAAERLMMPLLDIFQSIPILSILPGVVLALVALFPHSTFGLELAAVLLIFTSQAWNMAFSFHQSLSTIPRELREAASVYRLTRWQRFTRLEVPFGMIPLIWNSMMSWAGGWFFLMASEQFTLGSHSFQLPGLGSYLQVAANNGDVGAMLLGLVTLILIIVLLDQLLWRPLIAWADRFKLEQTGSGIAPTSWVLRLLRRSALLGRVGDTFFAPVARSLDRLVTRVGSPRRSPRAAASPLQASHTSHPSHRRIRSRAGRSLARAAGILLVGGLVVALSIWGTLAAGGLLRHLGMGEVGTILKSTGATLVRTTAALLLAVSWTVPAGVAIGLNPRLARRAQPIVQMVASIPATALFPALLLVLIDLPGGLNYASVALMLLGTQWYVLFNVIAGAMAIPGDLREAALVFKLTGWRRWRSLVLPAIFPSLVTGMITATGGAWNASVVSEYVSFSNHTYSTVGLGALIADSANAANYPLLLAATLTMALVVVAINRLLWRRLYRLAERRYRLD
ncbi:MAG: ABC transporter permease subunit [Chloroflexi bacterium]|nr:ABC transporter permease subunit [Chloroflexota bacterium]